MYRILRAILFFPSITKRKILILLGISLTATFFEGFGVAMLFPVMDFIEKGKDFSVLAKSSRMWLYINHVFDFLSVPKNLIALMGTVFILLLMRQFLNYLKNTYSNWITESIFADIRSYGFGWFAQADMQFYDRHGVGELINVLTVDGIRAGGGIFTFFTFFATSMIFALYFAFLLLLSPGMTLFAMGIMACVGVILKSRIRKSADIGMEVSRYNERISATIVERLGGIRLLKLSATEGKEANFVEELSEKIKLNSYSLAKIRARMEFMVDPLVILAGLIILYLSVDVFQMSLAKTGIFIFVLLRLMPYTKDLFNARQTLASFSGSLFRVRDFFQKAVQAHVIRGGEIVDVKITKGIRFENVWFSYNGSGSDVLKDINLFVPAGRMTALIGRSGAGKSTLLDLIPRLRVPAQGKITIDDVPIESFSLSALRRSMAVVSQEGFLFNDTIENNIRYCRPEATEVQIKTAARMAYADHFIEAFPEGYGTWVGERGVRLSGGQRQRIILARALLQGASLIVLDEPTSSLDSESEQYIQNAIHEVRRQGKVTIMVIAHRLSTIKSADQIVVLDRGRIVEAGSPHDLMHEDSWYAEMVKIQTGDPEGSSSRWSN